MRAKADRDACIGAGVCTTYTNLFAIDDDDGKVRVTSEREIQPDEIDDVEDAVAMCPVVALSLVDDHTGGSGDGAATSEKGT